MILLWLLTRVYIFSLILKVVLLNAFYVRAISITLTDDLLIPVEEVTTVFIPS